MSTLEPASNESHNLISSLDRSRNRSSKYFDLISKKLNEKCASLSRNAEISGKLLHQLESINQLLDQSKHAVAKDDNSVVKWIEKKKRKRLARAKRKLRLEQREPVKLERSVSCVAATSSTGHTKKSQMGSYNRFSIVLNDGDGSSVEEVESDCELLSKKGKSLVHPWDSEEVNAPKSNSSLLFLTSSLNISIDQLVFEFKRSLQENFKAAVS